MNKKYQKQIWMTLLSVLVVSFVLLIATPVQAYHFPWDQGHDTTDWNDPPEPGPCEGGTCECDENDCDSKGSPVYLSTGQFNWIDTDVILKGRPQIEINRSYQSNDPRDGYFGNGWSFDHDRSLTLVADCSITVNGFCAGLKYIMRLGNGKRYEFTGGRIPVACGNTGCGPTTYPSVAPRGVFKTIERQADGTVKLISLDSSYDLYDSQSRLISVVDRNGNTINYQYSGQGILSRVADTNGRFLDFSHNSAGRISSITDHAARIWSYSYDVDGSLVSVTDPLGGIMNYQYQGYSPVGDANAYYQLTRITDPDNVVVSKITYNAARVRTYTEGENTYTYSYDTANRIATKRDSVGSVWRSKYNQDGLYIEKTDPLNRTVVYQRDSNGLVTGITDALGNQFDTTFDSLGRITSSTDPLDRKTLWEYTENDLWPIKLTSPSGRITTLEYDINSKLPIKIIDTSGAVTKMEYSSQGDLIVLIDAAGGRAEASYTNTGLLSQFRDPLGRITQFEYDSLGRLVKITNPAGETQQIAYDVLNRVIMQADGLNQVTTFRYDSAGRLSSVTDANNNISQYSYDIFGRIASVTEAGIAHSYTYNGNNTIASLTIGDTTTTLSYNSKQQLISQSIGSVSLSYNYDPNGRVTEINSNVGAIATVAYKYDAVGQRIRETQGTRSIDLEYNTEGELISYAQAGNTYKFQSDQLGQLAKLITPTGEYQLTYDSRGLLTQLQLPNGMQHMFIYDVASQLKAQDYSQSGGRSYDYQYDLVGRLTQATGDSTRQYSYDASSRLASASHDNINYNYSYDPVGNRTENNQTYISVNRLGEDATYIYSYDTQGNLTRKIDKVTGARSEYGYNSLNQLIVFNNYLDGISLIADVTASYTYDAIGRRVQKMVNGEITEYQWLGYELIGEYQNSLLRKTYSFAYGYAPIEFTVGGNTYSVHADHLDSPRYLTNQSGKIVWQNLPSPYGVSKVNDDPDGDGNKINFNVRFPGQYFDQETGLHYNYFRYYDSTTGRYITSDPIGLLYDFNGPQIQAAIESGLSVNVDSNSLNHLYNYVSGNPLSWTDQLGLAGSNQGSGGSSGKGTSNPYKHCKEHPTDPSKIICKQKGSGKKVVKPKPADWLGNNQNRAICGENCKKTATVVVAGGTAYLIYRCARMIPSLAPPLWWTIPGNLSVP